MQRHSLAQLAILGLLIVTASVYISGHLSSLKGTVSGLRGDLQSDPTPTTIVYKKEPGMKTGTLSKIIGETTITLDYEWDCTAEGWRRILEQWKIICDNPPPG